MASSDWNWRNWVPRLTWATDAPAAESKKPVELTKPARVEPFAHDVMEPRGSAPVAEAKVELLEAALARRPETLSFRLSPELYNLLRDRMLHDPVVAPRGLFQDQGRVPFDSLVPTREGRGFFDSYACITSQGIDPKVHYYKSEVETGEFQLQRRGWHGGFEASLGSGRITRSIPRVDVEQDMLVFKFPIGQAEREEAEQLLRRFCRQFVIAPETPIA